MSQPFVGEIRIFGGSFAPAGWWLCDGSLLPISENETLFNLIGTTYGGDGQQTFAVPDLRSRVPIHSGNSQGPGLTNRQLGEASGTESVTLTVNQIPIHNHVPQGQSGNATQNSPGGGVWATSSLNGYSVVAPATAMNVNALGSTGGNQPHDNMVPFLTVNFIISLFGIFPSQF